MKATIRFVLGFLLFSISLQPGFTENTKSDSASNSVATGAAIPPTDFHRFLPTLGKNFTRGLISPDNLAPMFFGSVGAATVRPWDRTISRKVTPFTGNIDQVGQILGSPVVMGLVGVSLIASPFTKNEKFRAFAFDLSQGFIMDYTLVQSTKHLVRRHRPNGEVSPVSFPSGHAADSFLLATVLNHYYGKKWGIPAYAVATFVAFSRVERGKHFPSDVIFGGTIGYVCARTAIDGHPGQQKKFSLFPFATRDSAGAYLDIHL